MAARSSSPWSRLLRIAVDVTGAIGNRDRYVQVAASRNALTPAADDLLMRWPVSKRVNRSRADDEDATLIERVELDASEGISFIR
jgi:hypothetical protein